MVYFETMNCFICEQSIAKTKFRRVLPKLVCTLFITDLSITNSDILICNSAYSCDCNIDSFAVVGKLYCVYCNS